MKKLVIFFLIVILSIKSYSQFGRLSPADSLRRDSINKATQQDYDQMLKQLNITNLRPGAKVETALVDGDVAFRRAYTRLQLAGLS